MTITRIIEITLLDIVAFVCAIICAVMSAMKGDWWMVLLFAMFCVLDVLRVWRDAELIEEDGIGGA